MSLKTREIYRSSKGDRWFLVHDAESGQVMVRHQPNLASGGQERSFQLGEFLSSNLHTPKRQNLLMLIGLLVSDDDEAEPS